MTVSIELATEYNDGDINTNHSIAPHLNDMIATRYSRRQVLRGGMSAAAAAMFGGVLLGGCGSDGAGAGQTSGGMSVTATASGASSAGRIVTLAGAVLGGTASTVAWAQTGGPSVAVSGASAMVATFTAPAVAAGTTMTFDFTAQGAGGQSAKSSVSVTIGAAMLGFTAVPKSRADVVSVPEGYTVTVLYRLGDPLAGNVGAFSNDGGDTNYAQRAGDHHDGMTFFGLSAARNSPDTTTNSRGLLALNHENITQGYLHVAGATTSGGRRPESEVIKEMDCHGVSVVEITRAGTWSYVPGSALNRRITPNTPTTFSGPAKGVALLRTVFSPTGVAGRGTINNCADGSTPWNTYLTNEENWAGYFRRDVGDAAVRTSAGTARENVSLARYGIPEGRTGNYGWSSVVPTDPAVTTYRRWNITASPTAAVDGTGDFRHEAFQFGSVVEIDPYDPASTPRKRTALGRMNHEGCTLGRRIAGVRPACYMGDDAQNEYIYKFVSATPWATADANATDRLSIGDKYLDAGTLYVARFNADGSGEWLPLVYGQGPLTGGNAAYAFVDQADVLINARLAADALGATRMDRPEWTAVNPVTGEMYATLTNNSSRTPATVNAANPRAYVDPKTTGGQTAGNPNGHIIRLREAGDTSEATGFVWDIYAFGSGADLDATNVNLSRLDATNDFSSPDGLWFSQPTNAGGQLTPVLWVETDDGAYTDVTNCMLLAAIPGKVGDGTTRSVTSTVGTATGTVTTWIGKAPGDTLRRFLVGPKECEITGITTTPDGRSLFVNIQHPGENGGPTNATSSWPATQEATAAVGTRPRSATIVITRNDGGVVGL